MDSEESTVSLRQQNDQLRQENEYLKLTLGLLRENQTLRSKLYGTDPSTAHGPLEKVSAVTWEDTLDDGCFTIDLLKAPHRTSSPLETTTAKKSALKSPHLDNDQQESYLPQVKVCVCACVPVCASVCVCVWSYPERLVGEIAFQLDRRILGNVFQEQHRLYGFTVANIPDKITQVCTHPVSGKVDESLRTRLTGQYHALLERLGRFGYNAGHHASFAEFMVNTYGILRQRPDPRSAQNSCYGNPASLQRLVVNTVPSTLLKDALLLHTCLCYLAEQDGKPLFLW
ncbi:speriolin-like protein isoform X1 [Alosa sapidissima]|uniref:speriolin-like protein isoform X1 n=1 Tax=Alosa sapidissima TaxID=34773 RepID=UPI001C0932F4|nr:speriolin-like protein isoform X1 [Alosa sapidissima]